MTDDELIDFVKDGFSGLSQDEYDRLIALARIGAWAERQLKTKDRQIEALHDRCEAMQAGGFNEKHGKLMP